MGHREGDLGLAKFKSTVWSIDEAKLLKGSIWPSLAAGQTCPSNVKIGGMYRNFGKME